MSWEASRIAFDTYQSKVKGWFPTIEGISTRNAERYGWVMGSNMAPTNKATNIRRSISSGIKALWDKLIK